MEWFSDWKDCVHLCHANLPVFNRISLIDRLKKLEQESEYVRPILAARTSSGVAAYMVLHPGSLATVGGLYLPNVSDAHLRTDGGMLIEDLVECASIEVELVQAVVTHGENPENVIEAQQACYRSAGMRLSAVLCQLELQLSHEQLDCEAASDEKTIESSILNDLTLVKASGVDDEELEQVVEQTYIDTLDVPELNGVRSTRNTIVGYAACVTTRPFPWWIVKRDNQSIGCLFLTPHGVETMELVYIGLIPQARRHGYANQLMSFVRNWSIGQGAARIVAAVDSRNQPALNLYRKFGYHQIGAANAWFVSC